MKAKKTKRTTKAIQQVDLSRIAKIVGLMLLVPLFGNSFVAGWDWSLGDFLFAAIMLFVTGYALEYANMTIKNSTNRLIAIITILAAFLIIWVELAVGIFD